MSDCLSMERTILYAPKARILVVDDNNMNLKVISKLLKDTAIMVDMVESGLESLDMLRTEHYDMVLMDHMMPEMDGVETFRKLRVLDCENKNVPVIALTANADPDAAVMYKNEGFADYVLKPVKPDSLKQIMLKHLDPKLLENPNCQSVVATEKEYDQDDFPIIEGLDWELAMSHFNDKAILWETLNNFYITIIPNVGKMNKLYSSVDTEEGIGNYRICVHSMKSSARLVGIVELAEYAQSLENAASKRDLAYIFANHARFLDRWMEYSIWLKPFFEQEKGSANFDEQEFLAYLDQLVAASEILDLDTMDPVAKKMSEYDMPWEDGKKALSELLAAVVDLDTERIVLLAEKLSDFLKK